MVQETEYVELFDGTTITKDDVISFLKSKYDNAYYNGMTKVTDFNEGSEAYHLIDTIATLFLEARDEINNNYLMSMIHTQAGEFLDNTGDMLGVYRKPSSPSTGYVLIYYHPTPLTSTEILDEGKGTICDLEEPVILDGLTCTTDDSISFIVEDTGTKLNNKKYVKLEAVCEYDGNYTNVHPDTIKILENDFPPYVRITNLEFTGGSDIESDDEYRARILNHPNNTPTGSMDWFQKIPFVDGMVTALVHDLKATTTGSSDVTIIYNPIDKEETMQECTGGQYQITGTYYPSEYALRQFFEIDEYNIVGVDIAYEKATPQYVLADDTIPGYTIKYKIHVNINTGEYQEADLSTITEPVQEAVKKFNEDANIGQSFNPNNLCLLIEEIPEVLAANIYQVANSQGVETWGLVTEPIMMNLDEVYQVSSDVEIVDEGADNGLVTPPKKQDEP